MINLPKVVTRRSKRVGRGGGSGKGFHTTGRGQKGQKARGKVHILFEGVKTKKSLLHRLPHLRGKTKFKSWTKKATITTSQLNVFDDGQEITLASLKEKGLVRPNVKKVKIAFNGNTEKKLIINVPATQTAAKHLK
jgi:large subunit ribosomal protein L15